MIWSIFGSAYCNWIYRHSWAGPRAQRACVDQQLFTPQEWWLVCFDWPLLGFTWTAALVLIYGKAIDVLFKQYDHWSCTLLLFIVKCHNRMITQGLVYELLCCGVILMLGVSRIKRSIKSGALWSNILKICGDFVTQGAVTVAGLGGSLLDIHLFALLWKVRRVVKNHFCTKMKVDPVLLVGNS